MVSVETCFAKQFRQRSRPSPCAKIFLDQECRWLYGLKNLTANDSPPFLSSLSIPALQWLHDGVRVGREFDKKVHSRDIRIPVLLRHKKPRRMQKVALPSFPFLFSPPLEFSFAFYVQTGFSSPIFFSSRHEMCIPEFYAALFLSIFPTVSYVGERTPPTYLSKRRCLAVCVSDF